MSFISAIPPYVGLAHSARAVTSLQGRHPFDSPPPIVGTMKIDSSMFHALGGARNACHSRGLLIARQALRHKAWRAMRKVFHGASLKVETLRVFARTEVRACDTAQKRAPSSRLSGDERLTRRLQGYGQCADEVLLRVQRLRSVRQIDPSRSLFTDLRRVPRNVSLRTFTC